MTNKIYAESMNYWKTSSITPGSWQDKTSQQIKKLGGTVHMIGEVIHDSGRPAYVILFEIGGDRFQLVWPTLPLKKNTINNRKSAAIQAATMMFHDVKARCLSAYVLGTKKAFFSYYLLDDGRVASDVGDGDLRKNLFGRLLGETIEPRDE